MTSDIHTLTISFYLTADQAQALLDVLRSTAAEDHFQTAAGVRLFNSASDACRAALVEALEPDKDETT